VNEEQAVAHFLRNGTAEAFCLMFGAVYNRVRRYFVLGGLDEMTAEDLAQNVLLKVYKHANELNRAENFHAWLFKIARNELISHHRKQEARIELVEFDALDADRLELAMISEGEFSRSQLMEWLDELESGDRELLTLRFVEGLSYEELAKVFELPVGTIKSRLFYVRRRLAQIIETSNPYLTRSGKRN